MKKAIELLLFLSLSIPAVLAQRRSEYVFTTLDVPGSTLTRALDINNSGQIVGRYDTDKARGYLLSQGTFTTIDVPGSTFTTAHGINDLAQIVGGYTDAGGVSHGFLLSEGKYITLDVPGSTFTQALGINNDREVVGWYRAGGIDHGFLRDEDGNYTEIAVPNQTRGYAIRINEWGDIVGNYSDTGGKLHGYLFDGDRDSFTSIDVPGATVTYDAVGINNDGAIVGRFRSGTTDHGYLLCEGSYTTIDFPGAAATSGHRINDSREIVGFYIDSSGHTHGYLLRRERKRRPNNPEGVLAPHPFFCQAPRD
jgi:probable HAF family extracellular repeat protein